LIGHLTKILAILLLELGLIPAHFLGRPGALAEPRVVGLADVRFQLGPCPRELVFIVDPDEPTSGCSSNRAFIPSARR